MTKNNKGLIITLIILLVVIIFMLGGIMTFLLTSHTGVKDFWNFEKYHQVIYDESFDAQSIEKLTIDSNAGDITIKNSNDNTVKITATGRHSETFSVSNESNNLLIESRISKNNIFRANANECNDITIYLPQDFAEIEIKSNYGDVDIENKINGRLNIECDYGDIDAYALFGVFDIHTNMGDIDVENISITESSYASTDLGDIDIDRTNDIRIDASTSLGECNIRNNNQQSNIILTAKTDLGDVEIND